MSFLEELKNNRDKQIMAISIAFFVLSFPAYFYFAAQGADPSGASNVVATYEIEGEPQYFELGSGDEFIADGETLSIDNLHTDSIDDADDMNIIGVRLTMTYTESEDTNGHLVLLAHKVVKQQQILSLEQPCMGSIMKPLVVVIMGIQVHTQLKYTG